MSLIGREVRIHKAGSEFDNWAGFVKTHEEGMVTVAFRSIYSFGDCYTETVPENDVDVVADYNPNVQYHEIPYAEWKQA